MNMQEDKLDMVFGPLGEGITNVVNLTRSRGSKALKKGRS